MLIREAQEIAGSIGYPSKMPGTAYGLPASACKTGGKLHAVAGTVCEECYALAGKYQIENVKASQAKRLAAIEHPAWENAMVRLLRRAHGLDGGRVARAVKSPGWHRWHDAGDLQNVRHLRRIVAVCERTPELQHWLPSREIGIIAEAQRLGLAIPRNLTIRISATKIDGAPTRAWPVTSSVYHKAAPRAGAHVCPAYQQGGECGECRACWSRDVAEVAYPKH